MSTTTLQPVTADELLHMPHKGFRYELVRGELKQMSPSGSEHGAIVGNLTGPLVQHVKANHLGVVYGAETGFKIATNPDTVRAPDIAFVSQDRIPSSGIPRGFWPGAPDLAVEVVSPRDTVYEVDEKVEEWLAAGAQAVWIVNPKRRTVTVHRASGEVTELRESDNLGGEDLVPGFLCHVSDVFI